MQLLLIIRVQVGTYDRVVHTDYGASQFLTVNYAVILITTIQVGTYGWVVYTDYRAPQFLTVNYTVSSDNQNPGMYI